MALIKCPECGKMYSEYADCCPECGCPVEDAQSEKKVEEQKQKLEERLAEPKGTPYGFIITIMLLIAIFVGAILYLFVFNK